MSTGALIIAAGATARREAFDPMQKMGSISVTHRIIMTFRLAEVSPIVVVMSQADQEAFGTFSSYANLHFLASEDPDSQMFDNVKLGLAYLEGLCDQVLITPVNIPLFSVDTAMQLMATGALAAVPVCDGVNGHPLLLSRGIIPWVMKHTGEGGLSGAVKSSGAKVHAVEVDDPAVYINSEQFSDWGKIIITHNRNQWRPIIKLQLAKETTFMGGASWQLLSLIETTGSVKLASSQMGISYSKAWKVLNNLEEQVGYHVLHRRAGGKKGGETHLTDQGKELVAQFEKFERECSKAVSKIFDRHFG